MQSVYRASGRKPVVQSGLVASIGISNCYTPELFRALCEKTRVKPSVLQNRFYAKTGYDVELRALCATHRVRYQSFWTLTANPHVLSDPRLRSIADRHGLTPAQTFFRGLMQHGIVPLTGTCLREHMQQDLDVAARVNTLLVSTGLSPPADAPAALRELVRREAQPLDRARSQVLDQDVGAFQQPLQDLSRRPVLDVER